MVELFIQSRYHVDRRKLKRRVKLFLEKVGVSLEDYDLSLAVVGDRKMGELNYKFCKKKETTPVLAFPMDVVAGLVPASGSADYQSASKEPTDSRHYKKAPTRLRQGFDGQARGATTPLIGCAEYEGNFLEAINNDLNMPKALAVMWDLVKSNYPPSAKMASLLKFDKVLGLKLDDITILPASPAGGRYYDIKKLPKEVKKIVKEREKLRKEEKWREADKLRRKIEKAGYRVEDTKEGAKIVSKIPNF